MRTRSRAATKDTCTFGNRTLSIDAAKTELEEGVKRFSGQPEVARFDGRARSPSRIKNRDILEKQLETLKNQKNEIAAAIDATEAELTSLKLQQMESKYQTDDTRLAKIKEDLRKLKTRMDVEREKLKLMPSALEAPATPAASGKSVEDIMGQMNTPATAKPATKPEGSKTDAKMPLAD